MIEFSLQRWVMATLLVKFCRWHFPQDRQEEGPWLMYLRDQCYDSEIFWIDTTFFWFQLQNGSTRMVMTVESVALTWLLLPALEDLSKKQERRTELSVSWEASIECQSRWKVNFSKISKIKIQEVHNPAPGNILSLARFPNIGEWSEYFKPCEMGMFCSWSFQKFGSSLSWWRWFSIKLAFPW